MPEYDNHSKDVDQVGLPEFDLSRLEENRVEEAHFDYAKKPKKKKKKKKENLGNAQVNIHDPNEAYPEERVIYADKTGSVVVEHMKKPRVRPPAPPTKTGRALDHGAVRRFWFELPSLRKRGLLHVEKSTILQSMRAGEKYNCSCAACGRKRDVVEAELERIFNLYYPAFAVSDGELETFFPFERETPSHAGSEAPCELACGSLTEMSQGAATGGSPRVSQEQGKDTARGIMSVADDLLRNNGEKFIGMMERLAESRISREVDPSREEPPSDEEYYDEDYHSEYEEDEYDERERIEQGLRMIQLHTDRMIYKRIIEAYRNYQADLEATSLIEDLELEEKRKEEAKEKKKKKEEEKKAKRKAERDTKEQERMRKEAEAAERVRLKEEEGRRKTEEARKKREEVKRLKLEADRQRIEKRLEAVAIAKAEAEAEANLRTRAEAEEREKAEAEEREKAQAEKREKAKAEERARVEAEEKARLEATAKAVAAARAAAEARARATAQATATQATRAATSQAQAQTLTTATSIALPHEQYPDSPQWNTQIFPSSLWTSVSGTQGSPLANGSSAVSDGVFTHAYTDTGFTQYSRAGSGFSGYGPGESTFSQRAGTDTGINPFGQSEPGYVAPRYNGYAPYTPPFDQPQGFKPESFSYDLPCLSAGTDNVSSKLGSLSLGARQRSSVASQGMIDLNTSLNSGGYTSGIWSQTPQPLAYAPTHAYGQQTFQPSNSFSQTPAYVAPEGYTQTRAFALVNPYHDPGFAHSVCASATRTLASGGQGPVRAASLCNAIRSTSPLLQDLDLNSFMKIMMESGDFMVSYDADGCGVISQTGGTSGLSVGRGGARSDNNGHNSGPDLASWTPPQSTVAPTPHFDGYSGTW